LGDAVIDGSDATAATVQLVFTYTGADQAFVVPPGVTAVSIQAWGAGGGGTNVGSTAAAAGFAGGTLAVVPGETLTVVVGGGGQFRSLLVTYGGGGAGGNDSSASNIDGASGGGRSAVRRGGADAITAGGGGGSAGGTATNAGTAFAVNSAGAGGGAAGQAVAASGCTTGPASGGTQTAGGAGGLGAGGRSGAPGGQYVGGAGGVSTSTNAGAGGGGGGGWFGGGGGAGQGPPASCGAGINSTRGQEAAGAGGSGFIGGVTNGTLVAGDRLTVGNAADPDYASGVGSAAVASGTRAGGPGLVVLAFEAPEPSLSIVKASTIVTLPGIGATIPYTFVVTNTGNVTLTAVSVNDTGTAGVACPTTNLASGASMTCTATHTVVQADVDAGRVVNLATVTGAPIGGAAIPAVVSKQVTITGAPTAALSIVKSSTATALPALGDAIPYTFLVTNIGDVTMTAIAVDDARTAGVSCPTTALAPGEAMTCTAGHVVVQTDVDAGSVVNVASVLGTPPGRSPIAPVPSNRVQVPGTGEALLSVVKASTVVTVHSVGVDVPYSLAVTNVGSVTLHDVAVDDPTTGPVACPASMLGPGMSMGCTASRAVTQADLDAGAVVNTARGHATSPTGTPTTAGSNTHAITVVQTASLAVAKSADTADVRVGEAVGFSIHVTNTGNVTVRDVAVDDPTAGMVACPPGPLAPSATITCRATDTATPADAVAGRLVNTAIATATSPAGAPIAPARSNQVLVLVRAGATTTTTAPPPLAGTPTASRSGRLPATGRPVAPLVWIGIVLLTSGAACLLASRRPTTL
jgi:uncharacterized repeat protein (TIGR01451 family)